MVVNAAATLAEANEWWTEISIFFSRVRVDAAKKASHTVVNMW